MYLPSDEGKWEELEHLYAAAAIEGLNGHVKLTRDIDSFLELIPRWQRWLQAITKSSFNRSPQAKLLVECVHNRELSFYPDKRLYRFSCVVDKIEELAGYEKLAYLFAIGPAGQNLSGEDNSSGKSSNWTVLDWTSTTIFLLNKQVELKISKLNPEQIRDYLVFFCSFLGGDMDEDDTIAPFLIPSTVAAFGWEDTLPTLEEISERQGLQMFSLSPDVDLSVRDEPDLPAAKIQETMSCNVGKANIRTEVTSVEKIRKIIESVFVTLNSQLSEIETETETETETGINQVVPYRSSNFLVWYKNALFRAQFSIDYQGQVAMKDDEPIVGATELPIPRWVVRKDVYFVPLLCREQKRENVTAQELLERIQKRITAPASRVRLRGLRVTEGIKTSAEFAGPVKLENVEFMDDVILDDTIFKHSLQLIRCSFLRHLNLRNVTVKGVFDLDNSYFYGAIKKQTGELENFNKIGEKYLPTIDLKSLNAKGGVFADRVIVFGQIFAQWARIGRVMRAQGLQVYFRNGVDKNMELLDSSYMQIDGPLDLRGYVPLKPVLGELQRTIIGGHAVMPGLHAYDLQLNGLHINGNLNLETCRIASSLTMNILLFHDHKNQECFWRSRVNGEFNTSRAQVGMMDTSGCSIGGPLTLVGLQLDDSLFARLSGNFRTRVLGNIDLSGAIIMGDIDLGGAEIKGQLYFITGKCTRLLMSVGSWLEQSEEARNLPRFRSTEARGVLLQDLQIGAGITLIGIQLLKEESSDNSSLAFAAGSFIAHGVRLGGGLRFWREDSRERLLADFNSSLSEMANEEIKKIMASIECSLDLRGIHTGDSINLGRCDVKENILLENAQIGGNLRAYIQRETSVCQARNFNADLAHIDGNADLRGLKLEGDLIAHELQVNGNLVLFENSGNWECGAEIKGKIDLEGMHTARLMLSSKNLCAQNDLLKEADTSKQARLILVRCRIGQFSMGNFETNGDGITFPHYVNLRAIQVADWDMKPNGEVQALLDKSEPFDAGNYIDIEHKLARIGEKRWADEVYRAMKNRSHNRDDQIGGAHTFKDVWENFLYRFDGLLFWLRDLSIDKLLLWIDAGLDWLNKLFSDHGTRPERMVLWLIFWMIPVIVVLADSRNVEFVRTVDGEEQVSGVPFSNGKKYDLRVHWDWRKAIGLSMSYAIPFYGSRPDVVRARLNGGICLFWTSENCSNNENALSPHEFAMIFSVIQFILWVMIAANLPTILRRRL